MLANAIHPFIFVRYKKPFMKKIKLIALSLMLFQTAFSQKQLSLEDIWLKNEFSIKRPAGFTPLKDGKSYAQITDNAVTKTADILIYDYATGIVTDTLVPGRLLIPQDSTKPITVTDFALSESEYLLLFPTAVEKIYRRSSLANYFYYDRAAKTLKPLSTKGKQQSPSISPNGTRIAFVRDNNIYMKDVSTGTETAVTTDGKKNEIINGVTDWVYEEEFSFVKAYQWSSDGQYLAYYRFDEREVPEYTIQYFNDTYPENYTYKYPKVGEKNSVVSIFIYNVSTGHSVPVNIGAEKDQYIPRIKWIGDSRDLCVFRMNRLQNKLELLKADASTGKSSIFYKEENKRYIEINDDITFFNHNQNFLWVSSKNGYNHIYYYSIGGKQILQVTHGNWDVTAFYGFDDKKGFLYFQNAEVSPMQRQVYSIRVDGSNKKLLTPWSGTNNAVFNPVLNYFLLSHSSADSVPSYSICNINGRVIRTLEKNTELKTKLADYSLSKKEFFTFPLADSTMLNGWMMKPVDFNPAKKYPVLMYVYGGPGSQQVVDAFDLNNSLFYNYLNQHGYIVACVDNRGTGARGEEFMKMTYLHLGKYETEDQISAAKYLASQKFVDGTRIGIMGWSYGGYMSALCLEHGAGIFKSAVSIAPVTNWKFYDSIYTERYMRTLKENKDGYEEMAPMNSADKIKGHLLLVHGLADDNVHYQNSAEFMKNLYKNNVKFQQLTFPDKNHGISGGNTRYYLFTQIADFLFSNL